MTKHIGAHAVSNGWLAVVFADGDWRTEFYPSIWSLWKYHSDATRILVDVPIGLPSDNRRRCDVAATRRLGPQGRRVFYAPIREAVDRRNLDTAKQVNERAGYSIQNPVWHRVPRIREVDEFLDANPGARDRLFETRPALCFYGLNGQEPVVAPRHSERGRARRTALLADEHPDAMAIYDDCRDRYLTPAYGSFLHTGGDVLDGLVVALTARRSASDLSRLPPGDGPPRDERGLPMQMLYPSDVNQMQLPLSGIE
jgi:predicted RNase H-like nuclease